MKIQLTLVRYSQCNQQRSCPFFLCKLTGHPIYSCLDAARLMNSSIGLEAFYFHEFKKKSKLSNGLDNCQN